MKTVLKIKKETKLYPKINQQQLKKSKAATTTSYNIVKININ